MVYVHARTPPVYGSAPLPQARPGRVVRARRRFRRSPMRAAARSASRRVSPRRGRPTRRTGRRSIWRKRPTMTTRRRGLPASSGCWRSPAMTPIRSTACRAPRRKARSRNSWPTASCRPTASSQAGIFRRLLAAAAQSGRRRLLLVQRHQITGDGGARRRRDGRDRHPRLVPGRRRAVPAAGSARRSAPALQLCRGGRRQRPHDQARRCAAVLGRQRARCAPATASSNSPTTRIAPRAA